MSDKSFPPMNERLNLKQKRGWFPAGDTFRKALAILSDGAFRLFTYLCLEADRRTVVPPVGHEALLAFLEGPRFAPGHGPFSAGCALRREQRVTVVEHFQVEGKLPGDQELLVVGIPGGPGAAIIVPPNGRPVEREELPSWKLADVQPTAPTRSPFKRARSLSKQLPGR